MVAASWADFEKGRNRRRIARSGRPGPWSRGGPRSASLEFPAIPGGVSSIRRSPELLGILRGIVDEVREDLLDEREVRPDPDVREVLADHRAFPPPRRASGARGLYAERSDPRRSRCRGGRSNVPARCRKRQDVLDEMSRAARDSVWRVLR